jgi:PhoPQ-activated pathogenicity-related protein
VNRLDAVGIAIARKDSVGSRQKHHQRSDQHDRNPAHSYSLFINNEAQRRLLLLVVLSSWNNKKLFNLAC